MNDVNVILYEEEDLGGTKQVIHDDSKDLTGLGLKWVSSIILEKNAQRWQVFTEKEFHGAHNTLDPGRVYKTLDDMGLGSPVLSLRKFYKPSSLVLYEDEEYGGEALELEKFSSDLPNLTSTPQRPLPEGARSIALKENAELWQAFTEVEYDGDKVNLEPGRCYSTLGSMGLKTPVKSMKKLKKPEEQ